MKINWRKFLIWSLIGLFVGINFLALAPQKTKAQDTIGAPTLKGIVFVQYSAEPGGASVEISPKIGLSGSTTSLGKNVKSCLYLWNPSETDYKLTFKKEGYQSVIIPIAIQNVTPFPETGNVYDNACKDDKNTIRITQDITLSKLTPGQPAEVNAPPSDGSSAYTGGSAAAGGADDALVKACSQSWKSRIPGLGIMFYNPLKGVICALIELVDDGLKALINFLEKIGSSDTANFKPPNGEYYKWIEKPWKMMLGIADIFVVIVLLFLAIINILHINYDTYQIKKSLPLLIIGAVMANFSLLICRMINDVSEVLLNTFTRGDPYEQIFRPLMQGIGYNFSNNTISGQFAQNLPLVGDLALLFIVLILSLITTIAVLVLAFILYIRIAVMVFLFIVAPIAFIMLAFPPTQGIFKQWWSNFTKWVFMKPIMFMLLWLAANINNNVFNLPLWMIRVALTYFAFVVPFKLGGAVMGAWGKFGTWATGTGKGGYLRRPIEESIDRKKKIAKGAAGSAWGNTRFGRFFDRGRKGEEMLVTDYENQRGRQMTDREQEIRLRNARFSDNEKELERAKNRLESTIKTQISLYIRAHQNESGREKLASQNAQEDVQREEDKAETAARGPVAGPAAVEQRLREKEVEHAKTELEISKGDTEALIREGAINNIDPADLQRIFGPDVPGAAAFTPMDIKSRYLNQDNRLTLLKERLTKRAGQDAQVLSEEDLRQNDDLRKTLDNLHEIGIDIESQYESNGDMVAGGGRTHLTYSQALEAAEQLRYRATTEEVGSTERQRLEQAAQYFDAEAQTFANDHQTYDIGMVNTICQRFDQQAIQFEAQANAATNDAERQLFTAQADIAMENSRNIRVRLNQNIRYDHYLTNNLAGRRQKIINPDIAEEIHVAEISNSPQQLITDVIRRDATGNLVGAYGTGEARGDWNDMRNAVTGNIHRSTEAGARATVVQLGAIHSIMKTARHGDAAGLQEINGFLDIMNTAGRTNFRNVAAQNAINSMNDKSRNAFHEEMARRHLINSGRIRAEDWQRLDQRGRAEAWTTLMTNDERNSTIQNLDFASLELKGQGIYSTAQRDFVDRFLTQAEEDPALQLSAGPGSRLGRSRAVDPSVFTENRQRRP